MQQQPAATEAVPRLYEWLDPAVGSIEPSSVPHPEGPRQWWGGPLDTEGLALGSVQAALTALQQFDATHARYGLTSAAVSASFGSIGHLRVAGREPTSFAPMSRYFRTADGWIRTHANYPHHAAALERALESSGTAAIAAALEKMTAGEAEQRIRAVGGIAAALRTASEWTNSPGGSPVL